MHGSAPLSNIHRCPVVLQICKICTVSEMQDSMQSVLHLLQTKPLRLDLDRSDIIY
ncbi:unnamed protein product [Brugia timori]|uniref:Uncharacterized protein n=1 Tax=Brugia timori TaxID=42155 RepID=A0A3P7Z978_9BILA|nr:unnamed protein product [Brugia timori]